FPSLMPLRNFTPWHWYRTDASGLFLAPKTIRHTHMGASQRSLAWVFSVLLNSYSPILQASANSAIIFPIGREFTITDKIFTLAANVAAPGWSVSELMIGGQTPIESCG